MDSQLKNLLRIIRFTPAVIVLFISFLVIIILLNSHKNEIQTQKNNIEKQFIKDEKERIKSNITTIYNYAKLLQSSEQTDLKKDLKSKIHNVHNVMMNIYEKNKDTKSKAEIIEQMKVAVDTIRYDNGNGYFSIHTLQGINILHPFKRSFEGTSILNRQDIKGTYTVQKAIDIAKEKGEGFFNWYFFKASGGSKQFEKIGIVKKFEPYGLLITTGVIKEDFENSLKRKMLDYISTLKYKNNGYLFIIGFDGTILYHPLEKMINGNIFKEKRFSHVNNKYKKFLLKEGSNRGDYLSFKPTIQEGIDTEELRVSYVKKIDDWEWMISTSFKLSDVQNVIETMKNIEDEKYNKYKKNIIFYGLILTIFLLIFSYLVSKSLEKMFSKYSKNLENQKDQLVLLKSNLDNAIKIATLGMWEWDVNKNITTWSDTMYEIYDIDKNTPLNLEFVESLILEEDLSLHREKVSQSLENKKSLTFQYRIKRNNEIRILLVVCETILENDKVIKLAGVVQDITEIKKLELEKIEKDKFIFEQSKLASMGEMIGNIAHQWRQPLSVISTGATGMQMQKEYGVLTDELFDKTCTEINKNAQYLSKTIDDFRNFIKGDRVKVNFNLSEDINSFLELVKGAIKNNNINLILDIKNEISINGYPNELIQCLINIFNNAKDALKESKIKDAYIFIATSIEKEKVHITIKDNAGGIPKDVLPRIFEPYFTTKQNSQGTGLGLSMTHNLIVDGMHGTIVANNISYQYEGRNYTGAKFTITLPL